MKHRWKNLIAALLILVAGGAARLPLEQRYTAAMREQKLLEPPLNMELRDELGQTFFIAVLGGFRSVVASIMELKAVQPFIDENWGLVDQYYALCCKLQPRQDFYWERRAHHLGDNARSSYELDPLRSEETRRVLVQRSVDQCIAVLLEGTKYCPDSAKLWSRLGHYAAMPWNPGRDHGKAAEYYARAASTPNARPMYYRFYVFELAQAPGRELEAWRRLHELYSDPSNRTTSVSFWLLKLLKRVKSMDPSAALPLELQMLLDPQSQPLLSPAQKRELHDLWNAIQHDQAREQNRLRQPKILSPGIEQQKR